MPATMMLRSTKVPSRAMTPPWRGVAGDGAYSVRPKELWECERNGMTGWARMSLSRERVVRRVFWAIQKYNDLQVGLVPFQA